MTTVVVWLGERIRRYLRGRHSLRAQVDSVVTPVVNVERLIDNYDIKQNSIAITANGTYYLTAALNDLDYYLEWGYMEATSGTFDMSDIELENVTTGDWVSFFGPILAHGYNVRLYVPAGYRLRVQVTNKTVNGTIVFHGIYSYFDAKVPRNA